MRQGMLIQAVARNHLLLGPERMGNPPFECLVTNIQTTFGRIKILHNEDLARPVGD